MFVGLLYWVWQYFARLQGLEGGEKPKDESDPVSAHKWPWNQTLKEYKKGCRTRESSEQFFPLKKKSTLLRYNLQAIKCTRLKCPVQWALANAYTHVTSISVRCKTFPSPQKFPCAPLLWIPTPGPQPLATSDSDCSRKSYEWNPTVCSLLSLALFSAV